VPLGAPPGVFGADMVPLGDDPVEVAPPGGDTDGVELGPDGVPPGLPVCAAARAGARAMIPTKSAMMSFCI
jgi:hypothetical protein